MSHVRAQIRTAVSAVLDDITTVYASRVYPLEADELPVILVYTNAEQIESQAFNTLDRVLELVVEIVAKSGDALDDELDDLLARCETAIAANPDLDGLAVEAIPVTIDVSVSTEGAQPVGRARLTYSVLYRTSSTDPQNVI